MNDLKTVKQMVKKVLEEDPQARNSDNYLYANISVSLNPDVAFLPFLIVLGKQEELGIPGFETVRRARQKIQAESLNLEPVKKLNQ